MRISAAGSELARAPSVRVNGRAVHGFTLLELLVVVAIIALATAGVALSLRDPEAAQLEREAQRLVALLESARAQSRASGVAVRWHPVAGGFQFDGLAPHALPEQWLAPTTLARGSPVLLLGPEPIIGPQEVLLGSASRLDRSVRVATDGLRPFAAGSESP